MGFINMMPVFTPRPFFIEMPLLRLSKALGTIGFTIKRGTWSTTSAHIYKANYHFLETFLSANPR
jgi:hypothetical protein